jgi:hypothetical protein
MQQQSLAELVVDPFREDPPETPPALVPRLLYPFLCCAAVLLCTLVAWPFADSAFNDDWSYSHLALKLSETGQMHYNGWGVPTALFQSLWGAVWIRVFGFSFDVLRIATLPFAVGFVLLVYALGRKVELHNTLALFGALTVGTSPLFLPFASSFMTEAYACFFITLCLYAAICSIEASTRTSATGWLWILTFSGILGGSNRQTVWIAPLVLIPYILWARCFERGFLRHAVAAFVICVSSLLFITQWFAPPQSPLRVVPSAVPDLILHQSFPAFGLVLSSLLTCMLVALPALLCFAPSWKKMGSVRIMGLSIASAAVVIALALVLGSFGLAPFRGNIFSPFGVLEQAEDALGFRVAWPIWLRIIVTLLVVFSGLAFWAIAKGKIKKQRYPVPMAVFAIFTGVYLLLLFPAALVGLAQDRYVLPLIPPLTIFILLQLQSPVRRIPTVAWACLLALAGYSVAATHDYCSSLRARALAARSLEDRGISRGRISAGFEYDGWTQLQLTGRINTPMPGDHIQRDVADQFWFWTYTKALRPEYVASYTGPSEPEGNAVVRIPFSTWIPPFHRWVIICRRAELLHASSRQSPWDSSPDH